MWRKIPDWFGFGPHRYDHGGHGHDHHGPQGHTHGVIDATIATTERGIWAIKWSFVILAMTAALQIAVVVFSGSVALLADTIHNVADATTAIPLWIAFVLARRKPTILALTKARRLPMKPLAFTLAPATWRDRVSG